QEGAEGRVLRRLASRVAGRVLEGAVALLLRAGRGRRRYGVELRLAGDLGVDGFDFRQQRVEPRGLVRRHPLVGGVLVVELVRLAGFGVAVRAQLLEFRHFKRLLWMAGGKETDARFCST